MMKKWGFETGKGLGRALQGRSEPISASTQKGRRGLGLKLKELEKAHIEFKPEDEVIQVQEEITWLQNDYKILPSSEEIIDWQNNRIEGERKNTINNETIFCDEILVLNVVNSKSVFARLDKTEMREARTRSNPFETIRGSIFLNRAAVKMANIDKACNFMFTEPPNVKSNELLYFADVCAGPGGFSEYVLWRKKWHAKGFGFTLKNENDFKLHDFYAGPCETFHPYYGPKNDGNVFDPENQIALKDLIMSQTENMGVHFMMSDGGFSVKGQENLQEILSKQLYLCQCLVALMIVRVNGHFVTKVFDLFTPFSVGLVYIMYRCFKRISIFKPNTSRPANSERYLICEGKLPNVGHIIDYLFKTNKRLLENSKTNDILELIPVEKLLSDNKFFDYVKSSNELIAQRQIIGLKKIAAYTENKNLIESKQAIMREQCLKYWGLPNQARTVPRRIDPLTKAQMLLQDALSVLEKSSYKYATKLSAENVKSTVLLNHCNWYCMPSSCGPNSPVENYTTFYLGMGRSQIYKYTDRGHWEQVNDLLIELPRKTLIYAEMVAEMRREERSLTKTYGLHIFDAFVLGGQNISGEYFIDRLELIELFCKALWKPIDRRFGSVRVKEFFPINCDIAKNLTVKIKIMKNGTKANGYYPKKYSYENDNDEAYYYVLRSIVFFKNTIHPWTCHYSSHKQQMYFYNQINNDSLWKLPSVGIANFAQTIQTRIIWNWASDKLLDMNKFIELLNTTSKSFKKT
ncbi:PREDICTED: cap-specific mRNA (nucleoside-2'-O-)-methyltransferase 1 [Ceratosolen solmsi marchali]|uniref:Cap-specific mRNA (nucleoside-2'-O-)-methyltransferase 1 n=1 Tax=Ceratosolen solmsi marchali TaxID=326594 RepID=A0AAJ6YWD1_9HYME|nr:PREDICTED: cap-specific mRNA (nucleoside-2'-O-)-methyltransferase 1 [Ceratosolen solmsi marchali]